ncbi:MAG: DinB family protein [Saprospiraceae bacterium]|nr:DinB family protein [Saprospiraceae bacterium]
MDKQFELLKATRINVLKALEEIPTASLLEIPPGFNNNILWNIYHVLASQQLLVYGLSQMPFCLDKAFVFQFKSGTKPSGEEDLKWIDFAKDNLLATVEQLSKDYQQSIFGDFKTIKTSYGLELQNIEDAIYFDNLHEAMHLGQIKAMQQQFIM